mmetsp:Transcript_28652/g.80956  ORF Transcript_28652/g.80956 Transcript_28652/m.80956 type:complete len:220 (+) Transcript_28652:231-890(+)
MSSPPFFRWSGMFQVVGSWKGTVHGRGVRAGSCCCPFSAPMQTSFTLRPSCTKTASNINADLGRCQSVVSKMAALPPSSFRIGAEYSAFSIVFMARSSRRTSGIVMSPTLSRTRRRITDASVSPTPAGSAPETMSGACVLLCSSIAMSIRFIRVCDARPSGSRFWPRTIIGARCCPTASQASSTDRTNWHVHWATPSGGSMLTPQTKGGCPNNATAENS